MPYALQLYCYETMETERKTTVPYLPAVRYRAQQRARDLRESTARQGVHNSPGEPQGREQTPPLFSQAISQGQLEEPEGIRSSSHNWGCRRELPRQLSELPLSRSREKICHKGREIHNEYGFRANNQSMDGVEETSPKRKFEGCDGSPRGEKRKRSPDSRGSDNEESESLDSEDSYSDTSSGDLWVGSDMECGQDPDSLGSDGDGEDSSSEGSPSDRTFRYSPRRSKNV